MNVIIRLLTPRVLHYKFGIELSNFTNIIYSIKLLRIVHWYNYMIVDIHNQSRVKLPFYPLITSCSLGTIAFVGMEFEPTLWPVPLGCDAAMKMEELVETKWNTGSFWSGSALPQSNNLRPLFMVFPVGFYNRFRPNNLPTPFPVPFFPLL